MARVVGDFDGDGRSDPGVYDPRLRTWQLQKSAEGYAKVVFGGAGVTPVVGDFDGDGRDDVGVYAPASGIWSLLGSTQGRWSTRFDGGGGTPLGGFPR